MPNARSVRPLRAVSTLVLGILAACGDKETNTPKIDPNAAAAIAVVDGGAQAGMPGAPLQSPVIVRVTNAQGSPLANTAVTFTVSRGLGSVGAATAVTATTDADGKAHTDWTLGVGSVRQLLTATAGKASQSVLAFADTARLLYISTPDTVNVGETIHLWVSAGLADAAGEAWGGSLVSISWTDGSWVSLSGLARADSTTKVYYRNDGTGHGLRAAASLVTNTTGNPTGGPRMFGLDFVANAAAKGKDVVFTLASDEFLGARTFTDLKGRVGVVGATVHVR